MLREWLLMKSSLRIEPVTADDYRESIRLSQKISVSINDALALIIMERQGIDEIYTFDRHFRQAKVRIVQE
jgi:predicted nucleic acid-binding protein